MNLVIGSTSQLAQYFPDNYEKISSRNIDLSKYETREFDRVFMTFAEQRTFLPEDQSDLFYDINVRETIKLVDFFKTRSKKVIIYGTSELWNNLSGPININMNFNFIMTHYVLSKKDLCKFIMDNRTCYENVVILHPYNFNSVHRKKGFLFGKIMDSILNRTKIEIGDTYFYRDVIHPKYVVERSIVANNDEIVGSGRLTFIRDFIEDLYSEMGMKYDDYVKEDVSFHVNTRNINYLNSSKNKYSYKTLLNDTLDDIRQLKDSLS